MRSYFHLPVRGRSPSSAAPATDAFEHTLQADVVAMVAQFRDSPEHCQVSLAMQCVKRVSYPKLFMTS